MVGEDSLRKGFRLCKRVEPDLARRLRALLLRRKDRTADYIEEIHRIERTNRRFTGFSYVNWREESEFTWEKGHEFLADPSSALVLEEVGKLHGSHADRWECINCHSITESISPLRRCGICKAVGTQIPRG
ncbi:MAG TPA: hypothetical protein VNZ52_00785 [Candidatus Thermoplasmatota archaeon]|nr:hypothetical protein [Candidatus Thermoplasmatota archaeon]